MIRKWPKYDFADNFLSEQARAAILKGLTHLGKIRIACQNVEDVLLNMFVFFPINQGWQI